MHGTDCRESRWRIIHSALVLLVFLALSSVEVVGQALPGESEGRPFVTDLVTTASQPDLAIGRMDSSEISRVEPTGLLQSGALARNLPPGLATPRSTRIDAARRAESASMASAPRLGEIPILGDVPSGPSPIRQALRNQSPAVANSADVDGIRKAGEARLLEDRNRLRRDSAGPARAEMALGPAGLVSSSAKGLARKTDLLPLPASPAGAAAPVDAGRQRAVETLLESIRNAPDPGEKDRLTLRLAAGYVGLGETEKARALYRQLSETAVEEAIRQTALTNLSRLSQRAKPTLDSRRETPLGGAPAESSEGGARP